MRSGPGNLLLGALRGLQGPLKTKQRRLRFLQKLPAFVGQRHHAGRAVEQPHVQVLLQLGQSLAGRLRTDVERRRGLAQAAELGRSDEDGDGTQLVDGHGDPSQTDYPL